LRRNASSRPPSPLSDARRPPQTAFVFSGPPWRSPARRETAHIPGGRGRRGQASSTRSRRTEWYNHVPTRLIVDPPADARGARPLQGALRAPVQMTSDRRDPLVLVVAPPGELRDDLTTRFSDLAPLAACARRLQGRAQSFNRGADVFLADELGHYLGRTCLLEGVRTRSARVMQCAALRPEAPSA